MENNVMIYQSVITDIKDIISFGQGKAYDAANKAMVLTYWHVGKRIVVGLYLIAIYITEYSYVGKNNMNDLYNFVEDSIKLLNNFKINNLDKTKLFYDVKINLFDIGNDRIYK